MRAPGPVTPASDEALAGDTAQGFRGQRTKQHRSFDEPAGKRNGAMPVDPFSPAWLVDLQSLTARYSGLGFTPDLAALTLAEAWGLYRYLAGVASGRCA